ncbi:MAG: hypothetical protein COU10_02325 [Candidatus Harrisonbacteria bacterium CG10_big_fil_rev_8_21_14_0_10_45_28]|uniref:Uncharacterized protein n=1 Tax=Candidatus Harrisonbacteria bacterium CG10_big_fil_rev_8_21_14_0_10_45_28 TaxID=1974586 RepID=A0A2H0UN56_9BACT|nr:MAG: hypothetical protein COU10_02325 [Candidatus Harrisonbacteria bacterium CG10_big_fil_rev_8_21_14_0_10_45_28]
MRRGIIAIILSLTALALLGSAALAQEPGVEVFWSWQADSVVPADYHGKALPTFASNIKVGVSVIRGGKIISPDSYRVLWLLNGVRFNGGGSSVITIPASSLNTSPIITVMIDGVGKNTFTDTKRLPLVKPQIVIDSAFIDYPGTTDGSVIISAKPYFFGKDIGRLLWQWTVNNILLADFVAGQNSARFVPIAEDGALIHAKVLARDPELSLIKADDTIDFIFRNQ